MIGCWEIGISRNEIMILLILVYRLDPFFVSLCENLMVNSSIVILSPSFKMTLNKANVDQLKRLKLANDRFSSLLLLLFWSMIVMMMMISVGNMRNKQIAFKHTSVVNSIKSFYKWEKIANRWHIRRARVSSPISSSKRSIFSQGDTRSTSHVWPILSQSN